MSLGSFWSSYPLKPPFRQLLYVSFGLERFYTGAPFLNMGQSNVGNTCVLHGIVSNNYKKYI